MHFCKDLANGSIKVVDTFTSDSLFYQQGVVKMLLRLIMWNIFKSIGEENALTEGKNCVTKSRLTTYANILNQNNIFPCFWSRTSMNRISLH